MNFVQKVGSTKKERTTNELVWLEKLQHRCGEDCTIKEKNANNAIAQFFGWMGPKAFNGTVFRWIGAMNQAAYEIANDRERADVLETKYIVEKMKDALNKEEMKWREERDTNKMQKRSAGVVTCEQTQAPKKTKKKKQSK